MLRYTQFCSSYHGLPSVGLWVSAGRFGEKAPEIRRFSPVLGWFFDALALGSSVLCRRMDDGHAFWSFACQRISTSKPRSGNAFSAISVVHLRQLTAV